jgi:hypothetical protein
MKRDLLDRLRALEIELHRLETRRNRDRLEQLLHPDFVEFARSGRRYSRREVLAEFSESDATLEPVHAEQFELVELDRGIALLTYLSAHEAKTGELFGYTLRSSLWVETKAGWRMRFHQGTPAEVPTVVAEAALGGHEKKTS